MNPGTLGLILASVGLSALAQITLKHGVTPPPASSGDLAGPGTIASFLGTMGNGYVLLGLAMYGAGALVWLLVLARLDVSVAYPFVGLGFVVTMLLGWLLFGEPLGPARIVGTLMVVAGVMLIARTS